MIQDPNLIPDSFKVISWAGGAAFTMWLVRQTVGLFKDSRKNENGRANGNATKKAVDWALHTKEQSDLHECTKEIVKTQASQAQLLERLTTSYERQTELLESINLANKRR